MHDDGGVPSPRSEQALPVTGYSDVTRIGRGGSGVVYRAWQTDFGRWVAIKVMKIGSGTTPLSQFQRERMAIGMLSGHPNIVTVYDAGVTPEGTAYIVMEYLPDGTFADRLRQGPIPWQEAVAVGIKVSGALESAHRSGVLHLDVKPENLFSSGDLDTVKLGDFGIATIQGTTQTQRLMISGTLLHIPPERLGGERPTVASDVYSLGSTVFTLVSGSAPFGRADELDGVVMSRILGDRGAVPDLGALGLPRPVSRVLEVALAQDPISRQASAVEFGEQLRAAQAELGLTPTAMSVRGPTGPAPSPAPQGHGTGSPAAGTLPPTPTSVDPEEAENGETPSLQPRRPVDRRIVLTVVASVVALVGSIALFWPSGPSGKDPVETTSSTVAPVQAEEQSEIFQDDFSDPAGGWTRDGGIADYEAGAYRMRITGGPTRRIIGAPERNPIVRALTGPGLNTHLHVDVRFVLPNTHGAAGLYCFSQPETRDRYQGVISSDGRWAITKDGRDDPVRELGSGPVTPALSDNASRIRFECSSAGRRTTLRLMVEGALVGQATDENGLHGGAFGVVVTTVRAPGVEALFDNFRAVRV